MDDERPESVKRAEREARQAKEDLEKLRALILRFREQDGLVLRGHNHPNGSDWYQCPCCGAMQRIKGCASDYTWDLSEVEHCADCALVALDAEIKSWNT